jgi:ketosteroid isomerase-like protein
VFETAQGIVQKLQLALSNGDYANLEQILAKDVIYHLPSDTFFGGVYRGIVDVRALLIRFGEYHRQHPAAIQVVSISGGEGHVIVRMAHQTLLNEKPMQWFQNSLFVINEGQIVTCWVFVDNPQAYSQYWSAVMQEGAKAKGAVGGADAPAINPSARPAQTGSSLPLL